MVYYVIVGYLSNSKDGNKISGFILDLRNRFTLSKR